MRQKTTERIEFVVNLLKERKGETVSATEISNQVKLSRSYFLNWMNDLMKTHPQIVNVSPLGTEAVYKWVEDKILPTPSTTMIDPVSGKTFKITDIELEHFKIPQLSSKNGEGYSDPTPAKATGKDSKRYPKEGEIWQTVESNGVNGFIFVLNNLNGAAQCVKLYPKTDENLEIAGPDHFEVKIRNLDYIGDPTHATFKPLKYCTRIACPSLPGKLKEVRQKIADSFGVVIPAAIPKILKVTDPDILKENYELKGKNTKLNGRCKELETKLGELLAAGVALPEKSDDYDMVVIEKERDIWKEVALKLLERETK